MSQVDTNNKVAYQTQTMSHKDDGAIDHMWCFDSKLYVIISF